MKRWHDEEALMLRRWREELDNHTNRVFNEVRPGCHCLRGKGFMRKRRPHDSHGPNQHCTLCEAERQERRQSRKRERADSRRVIVEELAA